MKMCLYSVLDVKAKAFISPFSLPNDSMALRAFGDCVQDASHMFSKHPQDYMLYRIGSFETDTGVLEAGKELLTEAVLLKPVSAVPMVGRGGL